MDPNWKKAQEKVKKMFKAHEGLRKDFWFKEFTDTYQAQGTIVQDQPSDMWYLDSGQFGLIEIKTNEQARFPFKDIRPSQIAGAMRCLAAGGVSTFLICKLPEWQWHFVDGQTILDMRRNGDKSMKWADMHAITLKVENIL
ncbi:MAG: hypothetical protein DRJ64_08295 [Thermoprotei archaeon]|nr:MAG: hypothetical protein DRJ64_08295 [Thermoprotei archaeon]